MLDSPVAKQSRSGPVTIGDATLQVDSGAGWLYANPESGLYVAGYHGPEPATLRLSVPNDEVEVGAVSCGVVVWHQGQVTVDALRT